MEQNPTPPPNRTLLVVAALLGVTGTLLAMGAGWAGTLAVICFLGGSLCLIGAGACAGVFLGVRKPRGSNADKQPSFAAPPVGFVDALKRGFTTWPTFRGRASRSEYWYWVLGATLLNVAANVVLVIVATALPDESVTATAAGITVYALGLWLGVNSLALSVRRYHDIGRSGGALAAMMGGSTGGAILMAAGAIAFAYSSYRKVLAMETGPYLAVGGVLLSLGLVISAFFISWIIALHCRAGDPEANRYNALVNRGRERRQTQQ